MPRVAYQNCQNADQSGDETLLRSLNSEKKYSRKMNCVLTWLKNQLIDTNKDKM